MILNCTLEELNAFMKSAFTEKALNLVRLVVEVHVKDMSQFVKVYPSNLTAEDYKTYDAAKANIADGNIAAIKAVRAATNCSLKEGKDFIERWFPGAPYEGVT